MSVTYRSCRISNACRTTSGSVSFIRFAAIGVSVFVRLSPGWRFQITLVGPPIAYPRALDHLAEFPAVGHPDIQRQHHRPP